MSEQPVHVNKVSWQALCPWTIIFRSLSAATSVPVIILSLLGVVAMPMGWIVSETLFIDQSLQVGRTNERDHSVQSQPVQTRLPRDR